MISKKLFDQIQIALVQNGKPRKKRGPENFQFLGFATCGECGYAITAERKIKKSGLKYIYYHCTFKSKTRKCSQNRFLREEVLTEQVKNLCQKVSLSDEWREKFLAKLENENKESRHASDLFAQNLRDNISAIKIRLERLTDAYLGEALELGEYQEKKNILMSEKKTLEEKLSDFERKGNHWLELMRNWIIEANLSSAHPKNRSFRGSTTLKILKSGCPYTAVCARMFKPRKCGIFSRKVSHCGKQEII